MGIPYFGPQQGVTREDILARIVSLDVPSAVETLNRIFPIQKTEANGREDFGEESSYQPETALSYAVEHRTLFEPLSRLYENVRIIGAAPNHETGAVG
jgi:phosphoenolpyruvate carboxylase